MYGMITNERAKRHKSRCMERRRYFLRQPELEAAGMKGAAAEKAFRTMLVARLKADKAQVAADESGEKRLRRYGWTVDKILRMRKGWDRSIAMMANILIENK